MNRQEILALHEKELRIEFDDPDLLKQDLPLVTRLVRADPPMGFIRHSRLNETNAEAVIQEQMAYFADRDLPFVWDVYAYDKPADLEDRLVAYGFKHDLEPADPGAVLILDLHKSPPRLLTPVTADVHRVANPRQLDDIVRIEEEGMHRTRLTTITIGFGVGLLLLAACAPPTPEAPEFPTGRFVNENGDEESQFNEDGTWSYFVGQSQNPAVEGTYSIDGDLYTDETNTDEDCPFPGTYTWSYDGRNLTFRLVEDECEGRPSAYGQRFSGPQ